MSGVCENSASPMTGICDRPGMGKRLERLDLRRRGDLGQRQPVGEIGEAGGEQRDADADHMLRQAERHGERRVQQAEHGAGKGRDQHAGPQIAAGIDGEPAGEGAGRHDALDAEIEHAGALADQLAHGGEDQRRGDADRGDPEGGGEEDVEGLLHHLHLTLNRDSRIATTMVSSAVATMTSAM